MNTEQQAKQLRLAADIIETRHPWHLYRAGKLYDSDPKAPPQYYASRPEVPEGPFEIRLALATPPDGRALHNPDSLTAEQVGAGWRLVCYDDKTYVEKLEKWTSGGWLAVHSIGQLSFRHCGSTYRVPLSIPWPESKPDPYAELKKAHAAGKVIQFEDDGGIWRDIENPNWRLPAYDYRIKPEKPAFQLPPAPPGMRWHTDKDWKEGDLPQGWRPLVVGEEEHDEDEFGSRINNAWMPTPDSGKVVGAYYKVRTRRPLTFTHEGTTWTWHRPDDPMPCDGEKQVVLLRSNREKFATNEYSALGKKWTWDDPLIIGWRYADEKKVVPLDKDDILPCSIITGKDGGWAMVTGVGDEGITVDARDEPVSFEELAEHAKINRSIPLTGKWDANAWEPCSKQI